MVTIYTLESSGDRGNIRYIGMTSGTVESRLKNHLAEIKKEYPKSTYKINWIKKQLKLNYKIIITPIDYTEDKDWSWLEQYWIEQFKQWGFKLTNNTLGGEKGLVHNEETIEKLRFKAYFKSYPNNTLEQYKQYKEKKLKLKKRSLKLKKPLKRPIIVLYKETGKFYKEYNSIAECSKDMNLSYNKIQTIVSKRKESNRLKTTYKGFRFIYKSEYNPSLDYSIKTLRTPKFKEIKQFDLQGNYIQSFKTLKEISIKLNIPESTLSVHITGRSKTCRNFIFKYNTLNSLK